MNVHLAFANDRNWFSYVMFCIKTNTINDFAYKTL